MYNLNFSNPCSVYFIGIGGISMSGLAMVLLDKGFSVSGSDAHKSSLTARLEKAGVNIYYGQRAENISKTFDCVVYTAAVHPDNPEYSASKVLGLPMLTRAELMGQIMKNYQNSIAIAGTHGKTTTTSMISSIFVDAKKDPTISVGGILDSIGGNIHVGKSDIFITEACEYTNSFLSFHPTAAVILNIEEDHLDYFKDLADIRHSFHQFAKLLPENGVLVINKDIPSLNEITDGLACTILTFGSNDKADYYPSQISYDGKGNADFNLMHHGKNLGKILLHIPGEHNINNALAAAAIADYYHIPISFITSGLSSFSGTERRFQYKGEFQGISIIDDYAHHPTEIRATLNAAKHYPHREIWCIFQPHTYTRTKFFMKDFATALTIADHILLAPIFPARETDNLGISSQTLADEIIKLGKKCEAFSTFSEIEEYLKSHCIHGDLLITMGAGDVVNIGEDLLNL